MSLAVALQRYCCCPVHRGASLTKGQLPGSSAAYRGFLTVSSADLMPEPEHRVLLYRYPQLVQGTLYKRYKRFLADVSFEDSSNFASASVAAATTASTDAAQVAVGLASAENSMGCDSSDGPHAQPAKRRRRCKANTTSVDSSITLASAVRTTDPVAVGAAAATAVAVSSAAAAVTVVHCPNTGSMMGLLDALPTPAACSISAVATRKYKHTLEMICLPSRPNSSSSTTTTMKPLQQQTTWVGVHSALANKLVKEALTKRLLPQIGEYDLIQAEVKVGNSRFDFLLTRANGSKVYVEVKSITLAIPYSDWADLGRAVADVAAAAVGKGSSSACKKAQKCTLAATGAPVQPTAAAAADIPANGMIALFPDAVSDRAQKHVQELTQLVAAGHEAVCIFAIQRSDCCCFAPAAHIDPAYTTAVRTAAAAGVQMVAVVCEPDPQAGSIWFKGCVPVLC